MRFSGKTLWIGLIALGLVFASIFFFLVDKKKIPKENESPTSFSTEPSATARNAEEAPLPVKVAPVVRRNLLIRLKTPGEAVTEKKIVLRAETSGVVKTLGVREGSRVREGDILLRLDDEEHKLRLERHEAMRLKYLSELLLEDKFTFGESLPSDAGRESIDRLRGEFEKANALYEKGLIPRADYEKLKKDYEKRLIESGGKKEQVRAAAKGLTQAEIDCELARLDLQKTRIKAPFAGVVTDIRVSADEHITNGQELMTLVNTDQVKVLAGVLESEIDKIKPGREVNVRFTAYPGKLFKGIVDAVSPLVDPSGRTCKVHILMTDPAGEIKPGMHAEVEIVSEIYKNRLLVPQSAVLVRGGRKLVFAVEGERAKWRYVDVGVENEEYAEILSGVLEGEMVIVEGHFTLAHDARVAAVKDVF